MVFSPALFTHHFLPQMGKPYFFIIIIIIKTFIGINRTYEVFKFQNTSAAVPKYYLFLWVEKLTDTRILGRKKNDEGENMKQLFL